MPKNLPVPGENKDTALHVSFAGGGVAISRRKVPEKHLKITKLQSEVGVNMPLLRSLVEAHKIAVYHRNESEAPEVLKKAAAEAIEAVERLFAIQVSFLRTTDKTGKALASKLAKAKEALQASQTAPPSTGSKADIRERLAFLDDLSRILQRASQGQQAYVMRQARALADAEGYLERVHKQARVTANPPKPKPPKKAKAPKKAAPVKVPTIDLPFIPLPPPEEGQAPEADSPILQ